ncbi:MULTISPECIES: SAM-dependent methyltransferase [Mycolicibacterium]|uniref:S-adenosyl-L-methionine-dependent methyltransferase n=3 Tax=Mycolicibacterium TaxID=1866885 RepID=A0AAE5AEM3_MYCFO|nr:MULTISPECIES: class I SAM-dependent methyltransferase [Mycolicibacterium]MCV7142497.1 class I SAM-dependent methyltransferase [Mycolicibacterium fortuitum]MDV7193405.1 class I SAM-dependent methyltransferase [Mycolicibacterium fortuitum]MDV7206826.1 class I SAM-dependent methyltransferase [Mycolicibacterium fortuitum]MDV7228344.1 class I SAM-dependent methyltransferase [Mycolicibacterium fortuitum]MDV7260452.1 class I SAM-dependent methyltransferase [Mycolicibacterium fortuitum]
MARTEGDSWDINESVGATALGVAAGRAAETNSENPLIRDPYAQMFLEAAGDGLWNMYLRPEELPAELAALDPHFKERMQAMMGYTASRTLFFDEFFTDAAASGIRQSVILAAGLDARAWRLDWPAGSVVYEIDQPKVLDFKFATLEARGVSPLATYVGVPIDLRNDWPAALRAAGFDPAAPTAWSAEGLLPYLTAEAQDVLFERITELSAPGSRVAVEAFSNEFFSAESFARREEQMQRYREAAAKLGREDIAASGNLLYEEERTEVVDWLEAHGWQATGVSAVDLLARNGRSMPEGLDDGIPESVFVDGRLS